MTGKKEVVVLRTKNIEAAKEALDYLMFNCREDGRTESESEEFKEEKHGDGPKHYAIELDHVVIEIYPEK